MAALVKEKDPVKGKIAMAKLLNSERPFKKVRHLPYFFFNLAGFVSLKYISNISSYVPFRLP